MLERTITLDPGATKNKDGKLVAMTEEVFHLLAEAARGKGPDEFVFTREGGTPIVEMRDVWYETCERAGLGRRLCVRCSKPPAADLRCPECGGKKLKYVGLILHDLRRSAVRNMMRRGVPQAGAMKISGHRTIAVFNRYNIVSEDDLRDAAKKIENGRENSLSTAQVSPRALGNPAVKPQLTN